MKDYPLIVITIFYILGIIIAKIFHIVIFLSLINQFVIVITIIILFVLLKIFFPGKLLLSFIALLLVTFIGCLSYSITESSLLRYPFKEGKIKDAIIYGTVEEIELNREYEIRMKITADSLRMNNKSVRLNHAFLSRIRDGSKKSLDSIYNVLKAGNYICLKGTISKGREQRNPGEFDYQNYLEQKGISGIFTAYSSKDCKIIKNTYTIFPNIVFDARKAIDESISRIHNTQTAALLKGLLVGDRSEIDDDTKTDFINTGVVHVLAVSGLHVAYILIIFIFVFGRLNLYLRSSLTIIGILIFIYLTGATASVVRSALMGIAIIFAFLSNRSLNIYNSLAISAFIILLINPIDLFDPGLQLSYAAVISIVSLTPFFTKRINEMKLKNIYVKKLLLFCTVSLAAQIGTLPFTLLYFKKLSLISLLANIIIVPLTGAMISIGILSLVVAVVWMKAALVFSSVNNILTVILYDIAHRLSSFQFSYLSIRQFSILDGVIFYTLISIFFYCYEKMKNKISRISLLLLVAANIVVLSSLDDKEYFRQGELNISAIDVGQGDSFVIQFPDNKTALIDAGETTNYFDNGERIVLPLLQQLGITKIDYGFISHVDSDHYSGFISLVLNGMIKEVYKPALDSSYQKDIRFEKFLKENNIPIHYYKRESLSIGNVQLYFLNNQNDSEYCKFKINDKSGIIKLVYGNNKFLFVGDAGKKAEMYLIKHYGNFLQSNLLKLGHHGSATSSSSEFLSIVNPNYAIISAGEYNKFKHPSPKTLQRLLEKEIKTLRTDKQGCIILNSNGESISSLNWKSL